MILNSCLVFRGDRQRRTRLVVTIHVVDISVSFSLALPYVGYWMFRVRKKEREPFQGVTYRSLICDLFLGVLDTPF